MLKFVYSFFLGLLLVVFVGMGIAAFYPSPKAPEYPTSLEGKSAPVKSEEAEVDKDAELLAATESTYNKEYEVYTVRSEDYNRNVAMIALGAAVILMVLGLVLESRASVIADGLLLGGTFTLLYSIGRSFAGDDPRYSFMVTAVGLLVTVFVGYRKFSPSIQPQKTRKH